VTGMCGATERRQDIPPNNWINLRHSAGMGREDGQYYYHFFYPQQRISLRNPASKGHARCDRVYRRGVAGFRWTRSIPLEDPRHRQSLLPGTNAFGDPKPANVHTRSFPKTTRCCSGSVRWQTGTRVVDRRNKLTICVSSKAITATPQARAANADGITSLQCRNAVRAEYASRSPHRPHRALAVYLISNQISAAPYRATATGSTVMHREALAGRTSPAGHADPVLRGRLGMQNNDPTRREDVKDPIGNWVAEGEVVMESERPCNGRRRERGLQLGEPWLTGAGEVTKNHNWSRSVSDPDSYCNLSRLLAAPHRPGANSTASMFRSTRKTPRCLSYLRRAKDSAGRRPQHVRS